jgi:hypothetical protein
MSTATVETIKIRVPEKVPAFFKAATPRLDLLVRVVGGECTVCDACREVWVRFETPDSPDCEFLIKQPSFAYLAKNSLIPASEVSQWKTEDISLRDPSYITPVSALSIQLEDLVELSAYADPESSRFALSSIAIGANSNGKECICVTDGKRMVWQGGSIDDIPREWNLIPLPWVKAVSKLVPKAERQKFRSLLIGEHNFELITPELRIGGRKTEGRFPHVGTVLVDCVADCQHDISDILPTRQEAKNAIENQRIQNDMTSARMTRIERRKAVFPDAVVMLHDVKINAQFWLDCLDMLRPHTLVPLVYAGNTKVVVRDQDRLHVIMGLTK